MLGFSLLGLALVLAVTSVLFPLTFATRAVVFSAAGAVSLLATMLALGTKLDKSVIPDDLEGTLEEWATDVEDDIEDLKAGRITPTHLMAILTMFISAVVTGAAIHFGKWASMWGPVPVLIPSLIASALVAWGFGNSAWFHYRKLRTPWWMYWVLIAGVAISTIGGIWCTEPSVPKYGANVEIVQQYDYGETRMYYFTQDILYRMGHTSIDLAHIDWGSVDFGDVDLDDDSAEGLAILALGVVIVVLVILLIIGSLVFPHFWFLAGFVFITIMTVMTIRELRVRPYRDRYSRSRY